jgi:general nucleoside transport system permease protein
MLNEILQATVIISMLSGMMRVATPILLAALGELITERAGILNLGVEGIVLTGAFVGFLVAFKTGSSIPVVLLAAMIAGGCMSLIMVFMAATLKVDQIVTGLALNLLASGITFYWFRVSFSTDVNIPTISTLKSLEIPLLSKIPVLGEVFFSQSLLTYIAFALVPVIWFFLNRTKYGLEIRILGENPKAIDIKGINVTQRQYMAAIFGGMLGGLGGASLTVASAGIFLPDMSAGRGWLAIVVVIAGNWRPFRIMLATLVFSFLDAFQLQAQSLGVEFPFQILLALPYILAIGFMVATRARSEAPRHLGRPYSR